MTYPENKCSQHHDCRINTTCTSDVVNSRIIQTFILTFWGIFMVIVPFLYRYYYDTNLLAYIAIIVSTMLLALHVCVVKVVKFTFSDLFVLLYLAYTLLNHLLRQQSTDIPHIAEWASLISIYCIARTCTRTEALLSFVIFACMVQACYGIMQYFSIVNPYRTDFIVTGSFMNPGPFGGFMAVGFVMAIISAFRTFKVRNGRWRIVIVAINIMIGYALWLSDSRAAWLAVIVAGGAFVVNLIKQRRLTMGIAIGLSAIFIVCLYFYRPASADARMFIWQVSGNAILEKPLFGHGARSFSAQYMILQADFFDEHPDASQIANANNNNHMFNEPLHVAFEQGVVGLTLFLAIIVSCFLSKRRSFLKYALLAWLIFSFFSYPSDVYPLKMIFPLLIGSIPGRTLCKWRICKWSRNMIVGFCLIALIFSVYGMRNDRRIVLLIKELHLERSTDTLSELTTHYKYMRGNLIYMSQYAKVLYDGGYWTEARIALNDLVKLLPSTEVLCDLGEVYRNLGEYDEAIKCYRTARSMMPSLLIPKVRLFGLYRDLGDKSSARVQALEIIHTKEKVTNQTTIDIKNKMRQFLDEEENNFCEMK